MKFFRSARTLAVAAAFALTLGLGTQAKAQVDGFSGHKIVDISGWRVKDGATTVFQPLAGGGSYSIELDAGAWFKFDGSSTKHYLTKLSAFYQLYTNVGVPNGTDVADPRPTNPTLPTGWSKDNPITNSEKQAWGYVAENESYNTGSSVLFPAGSTGRTYNGSVGNFAFNSATPIDANNTVLWGFHVGWTDTPYTFDTNTDPTTNTANVYWQFEGGVPPSSIPEPAFYQMSGLLILGGLGALRMRKNRNRK